MDTSKYRALFVEESREHLEHLSQLLVAIESAADRSPLIDELFRHAHSIKGMAASMHFGSITILAHRFEDLADRHRRSGAPFGQNLIDLLLRVVDVLGQDLALVDAEQTLNEHPELVAELGAAIATEAAASPTPAPVVAPAGTLASPAVPAETPGSDEARQPSLNVRVRFVEGCALPAARAYMVYRQLARLGEIVRAQPTLEQIKHGQMEGLEVTFALGGAVSPDDVDKAVRELAEIAAIEIEPLSARPSEPIAAGTSPHPDAAMEALKHASTIRVRTDVLDSLIDSVGELFILRERLDSLLGDTDRPDLQAALDALAGQIREIHRQVMTVRLIALRTLTDRYPRLIRDLAHTLSKEVELEVRGEEIELDRTVIEGLDNVLVHMLRNAVDHGLETAVERAEGGKSACGRVTISATRERDAVVVSIEDDGRGLDAERLRQAAFERGLISKHQVQTLSTQECYLLICLPGFSTKTEVSAVSGRGVGMDAVRSKVESLGGSLDIESELGRGTRFVVRLPLTLAIIHALLVEAAGCTFAIPAAKAVAVHELGRGLTREASGTRYLSFRQAMTPVVGLAEVLGLPNGRPAEHVVFVEEGRELVGLAVDRIVGYHEIVVKPLGEPLDRLEWFAGATILGDGQPILILDPRRALRARTAA